VHDSSTVDYVRISDALNALLFKPVPGAPVDEVLDRYYAPDFVFRTEGRTLDRAAFAAMAEAARDQVADGAVTVLDELRDGPAYAERHVYRLTTKGGGAQAREVMIFGTYAGDGRFQQLSEAGFDLDPTRP
jgi:hypothetical protein